MSYGPSGTLAHQAMLKRMSSNFDDPFAEGTMAQFDQIQSDGLVESPSVERDSKYLSFSMPNFPYRLYNDTFQQCYINIQAQLHGMFFLAESQWPTSMDTAPPPPELTCYRRNLFQITGSVTLPRSLRYIFTEDGQRIPIYELELAVSATESVEGNAVKIISVPWKTPTGTEAAKPEDKVEREPPTMPLDKLSGSDMDSDFHTIPVQWKRLQFRIATANNGRRKELQQHFRIHLKVTATVSTGEKFSIAESHSGAVIVRGRSPRNFAARKDVPLSSSSTSRKHIPTLSRSGDSSAPLHAITSAPKQSSPPDDIPRSHPTFDPQDMPKQEVDLNGWQHVQTPMSEHSPGHYSIPMNPTPPVAFTGAPSPDLPTPFNFAFSPIEIPHSSGPVSLHFDSDNEGGSSYGPPAQSSQASTRPPTSNPSPSLVNKPRSSTFMGGPAGNYNEPPPRKRHLSHNTPMTGGPPLANLQTTLQGQQIPTQAVVSPFDRPPLVQMTSHMSSGSPGGSYEYFPLTLEDWQPPVDAVFRPHAVHHAVSLDARSPPGRSKRYFSEMV